MALWIGLTVVGLIIIFLGLAFGLFGETTGEKGAGWAAAGATVVLYFVIFFIASIQNIGTGQVGMVYNYSGVLSGSPLQSGTHFVAPWNSVHTANVKTQKFTENNINAFSKESQTLTFDVQLNYHLDPTKLQHLYRDFGVDWFDVLVPNQVQQDVKEQVSHYHTVEIAPNRAQLSVKIQNALTTDLGKNGIIVDNLLISNFNYSKQFEQSIEAKQIAAQQVQTAQLQAQQVVAQAEGARRATIAKAEGQSKANSLLTKSLSPQVLRYLSIQAVQSLYGQAKVYVLPNNSGNLFNLGSLGNGSSTPTK